MRVRGVGCQCLRVPFPKPNHFASSSARVRDSLITRCQPRGVGGCHTPKPAWATLPSKRAREGQGHFPAPRNGQSREPPSDLAPFVVHHLPFQTPPKGSTLGTGKTGDLISQEENAGSLSRAMCSKRRAVLWQQHGLRLQSQGSPSSVTAHGVPLSPLLCM